MASTPVPRRVRWAVQVLNVCPDDQILEIGCGTGMAVWLICQRLDAGRITATDRSATAIRRATERNADHIASGKAVFEQLDLVDLALPGGQFDKIFAVNVNLFGVRPAGAELSTVKRLIRPDGVLYLFHEAPGLGGRAGRLVETEAMVLRRHGFRTETVVDGSASLAHVGARLAHAGRDVPDAALVPTGRRSVPAARGPHGTAGARGGR